MLPASRKAPAKTPAERVAAVRGHHPEAPMPQRAASSGASSAAEGEGGRPVEGEHAALAALHGRCAGGVREVCGMVREVCSGGVREV